jgi:hypothetical protein
MLQFTCKTQSFLGSRLHLPWEVRHSGLQLCSYDLSGGSFPLGNLFGLNIDKMIQIEDEDINSEKPQHLCLCMFWQ